MKKPILTTCFILAFSIATTITAFAGWEQSENHWKYSSNSTYYMNGWYWIDGNNDNIAECYYFDVDGIMLANTITPDNYTVNADGAWTADGIVQTKVVTQEKQTQQTDNSGFIPGTNIPSTGNPALDAEVAKSFENTTTTHGGDRPNWQGSTAPGVTIN